MKLKAISWVVFGLIDGTYTLEEFSAFVKEKLHVDQLRYVGDSQKRVRKAAICTGAGADVMKMAVKKGCDVLITGDLKYHEAQSALQMNLCVIDAGHYETEQIYVKRLSEKLRMAVEKKSMMWLLLSRRRKKTLLKGYRLS